MATTRFARRLWTWWRIDVATDVTDDSLIWREGTLDDAAALAEFGARAFAETFAADNDPSDMAAYLPTAYGEALQRAELLDPHVEFWVVEQRGALAAYAMLRIGGTDPSVHALRPLQIERFYVDATWHGRGIAGALMSRAFERAHTHHADALWLGVWERNARAIRFYEKHGFQAVGRQTFQLGSDLQNDLVMSRPAIA
jgi:diamine N-acetyltransferase